MNCYEAIDLMGEAIEGTLAAASRAGLDGHLAECGPCRVYMEQLTVTRRAIGQASVPASRNPRRDELIARFRKAFGKGE